MWLPLSTLHCTFRESQCELVWKASVVEGQRGLHSKDDVVLSVFSFVSTPFHTCYVRCLLYFLVVASFYCNDDSKYPSRTHTHTQ